MNNLGKNKFNYNNLKLRFSTSFESSGFTIQVAICDSLIKFAKLGESQSVLIGFGQVMGKRCMEILAQ